MTEYRNFPTCIFPDKGRTVEFALMQINTSQRFFKNLHFIKNPILNSAAIFLENHFRQLKLYSNLPN